VKCNPEIDNVFLGNVTSIISRLNYFWLPDVVFRSLLQQNRICAAKRT